MPELLDNHSVLLADYDDAESRNDVRVVYFTIGDMPVGAIFELGTLNMIATFSDDAISNCTYR